MTDQFVVNLGRQAMMAVLFVAGPFLALGLITGLAISIFQATTQINEQTLSFVPKIVAVLLGVVLFGPFMLHYMVDFAGSLFTHLPEWVR